MALVDLEGGNLTTAGLLPGLRRYADATHLATALRIAAHELVAYDAELASATAAGGRTLPRP